MKECFWGHFQQHIQGPRGENEADVFEEQQEPGRGAKGVTEGNGEGEAAGSGHRRPCRPREDFECSSVHEEET